MISVIIPVYNVEPYLRQCVDSIINQSYTALEILLIDDGSTDLCGTICDEYGMQDERVRVFHTENRGLSATRNLGIREAQGDYISFIDSDDWIEPDMYEVLLRRLQETDSDICLCGYKTDPFTLKVMFKQTAYTSTEALKALLEEEINNNVWNKLFRRELIQRVEKDGMVFPEGKNYEDISIMHRIVAAADMASVISEPKYHYRIRVGSISQNYTAKNLLDYADAYLTRFYYYRDEQAGLVSEKALQFVAAKGISKVWRWWYGCNLEEKRTHKKQIKELERFTREHIPLFGYKSWPKYSRLSAFFMHSKCNVSFAVLYGLNQLYRRLWPEKGNVI